MFDVTGVLTLLVLFALGGWGVVKARRARNRIVKWVGLVVASVFTLACTLLTCIAFVGYWKINMPPARPALTNLKVAGTPEQVARGARFASMCAGCHAPNGEPPLVGQNFMEGGPPAGVMWASNLTPAGETKDWSDAEIIRAIREGVHKSGRALIIMPSEIFRNLADDDAQAIVAYMRAQPPAGAPTPPTKLNVVGAILIGALVSTSAQAPVTQPIVAPPAGPTMMYGKYLVSVLACQACHGERLAGRPMGGLGPPGGPNLTAIVPSWSEESFTRTIRTGVDPAMRALNKEMPWKQLSAFATDDDLKAMYAYLHGLKLVERPDK